MNIRQIIPVLIVFSFLLYTGSRAVAHADEQEELKKQLEKEIEEISKEYNEIVRHENALVDSVERLRLEGEKLRKELELLEIRKRETEEERIQVSQSLEKLENQLLTYEKFISARLVALYKLGPLYSMKLLMALRKKPGWFRGFYIALSMAHHDKLLLERYEKMIQEFRKRKQYLSTIDRQYEFQLHDIQRKKQRLEQVLAQKERALRELRTQKDTYFQALQDLQRATNRISQYFGQSRYMPLLDIRKFKGLLTWPVQGKIIRPYGKIRVPQTGTYILSRGILIQVPVGTPVRAVFHGLVRYAGWFTTQGKLIVIDHGHNIYSLYGHNSKILVRKNSLVRKGQVIAYSGDTASFQGPALYFEIRNELKPENPLEWFRTSKPLP